MHTVLMFLILAIVVGIDPDVRQQPTDPSRLLRLSHEWMIGVDWSPDGEYLAYTTGGLLLVLHLDDNRLVFQQHGYFRTPRWSPDGTMLAVAGRGVRVFDTRHFQSILHYSGRSWRSNAIEWNPNSSQLAVLYEDNILEIVDIPSGYSRRLFSKFSLGGYDSPSYSFRLGWSPDGRFLVAQNGEYSGATNIIGMPTEDTPYVRLHPSNVYDRSGYYELFDVSWHPQGTRFVIAAEDGLFILQIPDDEVLWDKSIGLDERLTTAAEWSPDGRLLVSSPVIKDGNRTGDHRLVFWDGETLEFLREVDLPIDGRTFEISWSPDGRQIAIASMQGLGIYTVPD